MKIYTVLNIGDFHTNNCEDFLVSELIGTNERMIAVIDGCTMGENSVFASILFGKILKKIAKGYYYQELVTQTSKSLKNKLNEILKEVFTELRTTKNQLDLETTELLSTLIIGIVNTETTTSEFIAIGDGLIYHDGIINDYEQGDKPDYLAYHLDEDFDFWLQQQKQRLSIESFKNLSICTDGIFTFKNLKDASKQLSEKEIIDFLLNDDTNNEFKNMLNQKINHLKVKDNHVVTDDLAIIRLVKN